MNHTNILPCRTPPIWPGKHGVFWRPNSPGRTGFIPRAQSGTAHNETIGSPQKKRRGFWPPLKLFPILGPKRAPWENSLVYQRKNGPPGRKFLETPPPDFSRGDLGPTKTRRNFSWKAPLMKQTFFERGAPHYYGPSWGETTPTTLK